MECDSNGKLNYFTNVSFVTGYKNNFVGCTHEEKLQILHEKVTDFNVHLL